MTPICVDIATAASMIGMSPTVVRGYIDAGLIPVIKFPAAKLDDKSRRVLIAVADLEAFVTKHRVGTEVTK